jgi:hypothetical protein
MYTSVLPVQHHHQPIARVALLERTDVRNHLLGEIALALSFLTFGP